MISGTRYQLQREINRQQRLASDIARGQAEITAGGKRVLAPSDNPVAAARISEIGRTQSNTAIWKSNLDIAAALSSNAEGVMRSLTASFDRVNELMLAASNGTLSAQDREAAAIEIESIAEEIATLRDTRDSRGDPLFPTATTTIRIPVGANLDIAAVGTREALFDTVSTAGGPLSLTTILGSAVTALRANDPAAITTSLGAVQAGSTHVIAAHAEQGARGSRIDTLLDRSESSLIGLQEERGNVEGTVDDIPAIVARMQARQVSLEAAQAVFARINRSTLFDLIS